MNRITFQDEIGNFGIDGVDLINVDEEIYCAITKLCAYENTGLDPEEIEELKKEFERVNRLDKVNT